MDIQITPRTEQMIEEYRDLFRQIEDAKARIAELEVDIRQETGLSILKMRDGRRAIKNEHKDKKSFVYFVELVGQGVMKIGRAKDIASRVSSIQSSTPGEIKLLGTIPGGREVERDAHSHFAQHRARGEWFSLNPEVRSQVVHIVSSGTVPEPDVPPELEFLVRHVRRARYA